MEEVHGGKSRRVTVDFMPQRTANEILGWAFELLTTEKGSQPEVKSSVQSRKFPEPLLSCHSGKVTK